MISPTCIALLLTLLLPPTTYVIFSTSSMTIGLLLCAALWCFVGIATGSRPYLLKQSDTYRLGALLGGLALLTFHVIISNLEVGGVDFVRFFSSCAILSVLLAGAHFAARKIERISTKELVAGANLVLVSLTLLGFAAAVGVPAVGPQASVKPVVIFAEPSHFSLAYLPILLFRVSIARRQTQFALLGMTLVLALVLQSLTMIAGAMMVATVLLRKTSIIFLVAALAAGTFAVDVTYYASRLAFSSETTNLSTLVFMQGWENAILNFKETAGIGLGFQQFGIAGSTGGFADKVVEILGININLRDGGSTAPKLIGEFGFLGILAVVMFTRVAVRGALFVRRAQFRLASGRDQRALFFYSFIINYVIELFVRGAGYFSPGAFLAVVALLSLQSHAAVLKTSYPQAAALPESQPTSTGA